MIPCRVCNSNSSIKLFTKDNIDIVRCAACGLEYTDASCGPEELKELYSARYFQSGGAGKSYFDYLSEGPAMALNAARRLARIEALILLRKADRTIGFASQEYSRRNNSSEAKGSFSIAFAKENKKPKEGSRLLDVGCATGLFLKIASSRWDPAGVELSDFASSYARDTAGLSVMTGTLQEASYPDGRFDVVTMWDVIEHLPSPIDDLSEARRVMKDDGLLVLTTGDAGSVFARMCGKFWHLYNPIQHLSYFSKDTIRLLLNKAGFKVVKIEKDGNYFTLAYLTSSLAMYYPSMLSRALHRMAGKRSLKDIKFYVNLRDIITVYAMKRL